jgi:hypothetical protein
MISWYLHQLRVRPWTTKCISSCLIASAGDFTQQTIEKRTAYKNRHSHSDAAAAPFIFPLSSYDGARFLRMSFFGFAVVGPVFHLWFNALDRLIYPGRSAFFPHVTARLAADQIIMAPLFSASFFVIQGALEGRSSSDITSRVLSLTWPTLLMNYKIWPLTQFINFYLIPLQLRVLFLNAIGFGWNIFLSQMNNQSEIEKSIETPESSQN